MRPIAQGFILLLVALAGSLAVAAEPAQSTGAAPALRQWPTKAWIESSPEAQGVSSSDLADALDFARTSDINIHSLTVVRNGVIVLDAYFYPFVPAMRHDLASATKSVVSMLVGSATSDGYLGGLQQPVVSALPPTSTRRVDARVARIQIGDLLSMQSGLACGFKPGELELREMRSSSDWVANVLHLAPVAQPGTRFGYCSPNFHLLSAAIATTSRLTTLDYARAVLFAPLGIDDVYWPADPMGLNHGWGDLQLRPRDMAKLGLLMLQSGRWEDKQVLPKTWIENSVAVRARVNDNEDYGLGWWLSRRVPSLFEANGRGGQRISIVPNKNVVVVMTGGGFEPGDLGGYLLKALRADTPLPDDSNGRGRLAEALRSISTPPVPRAVAQSSVTKQVSGRIYTLQQNPIGVRSFAVEFSDSAEAVLRLGLSDGTELVQRLGLDGLYRVAPDKSGALSAGRGDWLPDGRFRAEFNRLARINRFLFVIDFRGDDVTIVASEPTEFGTVNLRGRAPQR
jgi:CubicO group peptidase (beta-lactamase class C family)